MTAALSTPLFQGGAACGACYELRCKPIQETNSAKNWCFSYSKSIVVTATNLCPPGSIGGWCDASFNHFDLPMPAFTTLADQVAGVVPVYWRRVPCQKQGGIRFTIAGNPWFLMILIHNVGGAGDVIKVMIKCQSTDWVPMYRNWGSIWTISQMMTGALSFQITTSDGSTVTTWNAVGDGWQFGQTWESVQMRY
jgi:expansin (peptidoglycan-binding protein)